jgi:intergrase/recombinase
MDNRFSQNPLDTMSDSDFKEFLKAKENDFTKETHNGVVIYDYYKWYDTFHKLQWHCYFNHKKILNERKITLSKTTEIIDLLISERENKKINQINK